MPRVCTITFEFSDLATAEFDADDEIVSISLDRLLRNAPSFVQCRHHGVYNYKCIKGAFNTIRIQKTGLFVIMHDGDLFDCHPLIGYLKSKLREIAPDAKFGKYA